MNQIKKTKRISSTDLIHGCWLKSDEGWWFERPEVNDLQRELSSKNDGRESLESLLQSSFTYKFKVLFHSGKR